MSSFWKQMDRRVSISAYNYNLGDEANPEHIDLTKTNQYAAYEVKKLDVGDNVFIRGSNDEWYFAKLTEKSSDEDGNVYTYQIGQDHKFKSLRENQLGDVRLVEVRSQRASHPKLDINQSSSCESYTDKVVQSNHQKKLSSQRGNIDIKSKRDDKENVPHTNKCNEATRSVAVSELSMASPVENVMKQRRSLGAAQLGDNSKEAKASSSSRFEQRSQPRIPKSISTRNTDVNAYVETETDEVGSLQQSRAKSLPSRGLSLRQQQLSSPSTHLNSIEEQHEEEVSHILDDLLKSEALLKDDQSKHKIQRSISKDSSTYQNSVSTASRSSLPASSSTEDDSRTRTRRQSLATKRQSDYQSTIMRQRAASNDDYNHKSSKHPAKVEYKTVVAAQPKSNNLNDATWRAKSDPEIVFTPSGEAKDTAKSDTCNNFNTANWRAKSDHEIVFMPSGGEENNVKESGPKTSNENTSSSSTALVLYPSSKQNSLDPNPDDFVGNSTEDQGIVNDQKRPSNGKKRGHNIFSGTKFFAKRFRKKASSEKTQRNSAKADSNSKVTNTANESSSENSRPSEPSFYPSVGQTNHHTRPNPSAYTAAAGFVPNCCTNQNVYYVSDPRLAQAYRNYAQHVARAQATQYLYNPSTCAQFNYQMSQIGHGGQIGMPSLQPNVIRVGTKGITGGANYRMSSVGHGIQIGLPSANTSNVIRINL
eukprot:scaffold3229_cov113-Skeletonema_dohrnii-CCMP3373.AAC.7